VAPRILEAGLVDELNITVAPVVVGEGRALFAGLKQRIDLHLILARPPGLRN